MCEGCRVFRWETGRHQHTQSKIGKKEGCFVRKAGSDSTDDSVTETTALVTINIEGDQHIKQS